MNQLPERVYYFDEHKRLSPDCVPNEIAAVTEKIDAAYERNRRTYFQRVISTIKPPAVRFGAPYMVAKDEESSADTALVVTLPYCNPIMPDVRDAAFVAAAAAKKDNKAFDSNTWNNPIKHLYLFDVMKALGIRDAAGNTVPVVAIGADSQDYKPRLTGEQKQALRRGSLAVYGRNVIDILDAEGVGMAHVAGYSQGASVAHTVLAQAANLDVLSGTLAEMPTYKSRSIGALAVNYLLNKPAPKNKSGIKKVARPWTESGPLARRELENIHNRAFMTMAQTIAKGAWRTAFALRKNSMLDDLRTAATERDAFPLTIARNATSSLTYDIDEVLLTAESPYQEVLRIFAEQDKLRLVKAVGHEAVGAPHLAGESPMYYAALIGESVAWAQRQS